LIVDEVWGFSKLLGTGNYGRLRRGVGISGDWNFKISECICVIGSLLSSYLFGSM